MKRLLFTAISFVFLAFTSGCATVTMNSFVPQLTSDDSINQRVAAIERSDGQIEIRLDPVRNTERRDMDAKMPLGFRSHHVLIPKDTVSLLKKLRINNSPSAQGLLTIRPGKSALVASASFMGHDSMIPIPLVRIPQGEPRTHFNSASLPLQWNLPVYIQTEGFRVDNRLWPRVLATGVGLALDVVLIETLPAWAWIPMDLAGFGVLFSEWSTDPLDRRLRILERKKLL